MDRPTQRLNEPSHPAPAHTCPKCGEVMIEASAATDGLPGRKVIIECWLDEAAGIFKIQRRQAACLAWVCVDCGYTEFYTVQPRKLLG